MRKKQKLLPRITEIIIALLLARVAVVFGQTTCNNGLGRVLYERLPNQQLQGFDDDVVRDTAPPFRVLEKCQDLCLRDRTPSKNLVRPCTSFDFQPGSRIASFSGTAEYEESTCYLTQEQAAPEGIGNLMLVPNSVHFTEICLTSNRPERECPSRRYVFERHPRKKLKLPVSDVKEMTAANRSDCEDKCLSEFSFVCRSANFDSTLRSCTLSRFTRRTHPELLEDDPNSDYIENTCLNAERRCDGLAIFVKEENKKLGGPFEVDIFNNMTLEECQSMCMRAEKYFCRSVEFDDQTKQCILSEEDSISQKDDISISSSPTHHFYDLVCLDNQRGSEYPDNSVTSHLFSNGRRPDTAFQRYRNSRLGGEFHSEITGRSLSECLDECLRQTSFQCRSAVYSDRFRTCRLSRYNQRDGMRIIYDADYDYYENLMLGGEGDGDRPSTRPGPSHPPGGHDPWTQPYPGDNRYPPSDDRFPPGRYPPTDNKIPYDRYPGGNQPDSQGDRYPQPPGGDRYPNTGERYPYDGGDRYQPGMGYPPAGPGYPDDRYPIGPSDRYPNMPGDRYPPGPGERYPGGPGERYPGGPGERYPAGPGERYPSGPGERYPVGPSERYPEMPGDRYPAMPGDRYPAMPGDRYPAMPGDRYPAMPGDRYPDGPNDRYPSSERYPMPPIDPSRPGYDSRYPDNRIPERGYPDRGYPPDRRYPDPLDTDNRYPAGRYPPPTDNRLPDRGYQPEIYPDTRYPPDRRYPVKVPVVPVPGGGDTRYPVTPPSRPPTDGRLPPVDSRYPATDSRYPTDPRYPTDNRYPVDDRRYPTMTGRYPADVPPERYPGDARYPPPGTMGGSGRYPVSENRFPVGNDRYPTNIYKYGNRERYPSGSGYDQFGGPSPGYYDRDPGYMAGGGGGGYFGMREPGYSGYDRGGYGGHQYRPLQSGGGGGAGGPAGYPPSGHPPSSGGYPPSGYDNSMGFNQGDGFGGYGPQRPYASRCDPEDSYKQVLTRQKLRRQYVRKVVAAPSLTHCQRECTEARDFVCKSFNYRDTALSYDTDRDREGANCELSDRDSRELDVQNPQIFDTGSYDFYERSTARNSVEDCLDVSQTCNEDGMEFTLRTPEGYVGRIYTYGFYDRCFFRGNGGTVNVLRISGPQGYPECGTQRYGDTMTNIVVVQFSDNVQTGKDKRFNLTCLFRGPGEAVVTSGYIGAGSGSPIPIEYLPAENTLSSKVRLMILYQGRPTTTIAVGDPLTFRLEAQDGYNHITDIFATNVVARDPYSGRSVQLIDRYGCPVDPYVFPELDKLREGDMLEARFNAFKIPESNFLVFEATVRTCREGCQPAYCPGQAGRSEPSFGRKKRSTNGTVITEGIVNTTDPTVNATTIQIEVVKINKNGTGDDGEEEIDMQEQVREMIEVFESRDEINHDVTFAKKMVSAPETVCLSPSEYHGLLSAVILLMILLLSIALVSGLAYRRYWTVMSKNHVLDRSSPIHSFSPSALHQNMNLSASQFNASGRDNRSGSSGGSNSRPTGLSLFSGTLNKTFATGNLSRMCQIPVINPIRNTDNSTEFDDPSEPIYTDPSLFERSRSLRSIAVGQSNEV